VTLFCLLQYFRFRQFPEYSGFSMFVATLTFRMNLLVKSYWLRTGWTMTGTVGEGVVRRRGQLWVYGHWVLRQLASNLQLGWMNRQAPPKRHAGKVLHSDVKTHHILNSVTATVTVSWYLVLMWHYGRKILSLGLVMKAPNQNVSQ